MGSGEEKKFARIESVKATRVLPEGTKDCPEHDDNDEFQLEERLLIDPKHLFVGPKIGEGAHSKVYEGKYKDKNVAIKIIQVGDNLEEKSKLERRFAREVALLARVQHKNLVKFIGAFKDSMMVVVTELLVGGSLRKHMTSLKPNCIEIRTALSFALDVAQAMECLHKNGIIHRDLKPDNLLLTADQKRVKLADFGLAREETVTEMMTAETGTYRWMAPELYSTVTLKRGEKKHYDHRVDVYSFSIVLWELLTNRMPFEGMSNLQAAYAAAFKNVRPSVENLPEDLVFILQCCWAEDPNMRPNFTQIVRMLSTYISSLPTPESTPPSPQTLPSRSSISSMTSPGASSMSGSQTDISGKLQKSPRKLISCFGSCIGS